MLSKSSTRIRALINLGRKCVCCGEKRFIVLEIDHKEEKDGKEDRKTNYRYISQLAQGRLLDRFQILCSNCHTIKTKLARRLKRAITLDDIKNEKEKREALTSLRIFDKNKTILTTTILVSNSKKQSQTVKPPKEEPFIDETELSSEEINQVRTTFGLPPL